MSLSLQPQWSLFLSHTGWLGIQRPVNQTHSAAVLYTTDVAAILSSLPITVSSLLNGPSGSSLSLWLAHMVFLCCVLFFFFSTPHFSFLPSLVFFPSGTLHCINQGLSAPHSGYSISTHHLTKRRTDRQRGREIYINFNVSCSTVSGKTGMQKTWSTESTGGKNLVFVMSWANICPLAAKCFITLASEPIIASACRCVVQLMNGVFF